MTVFKSYLKIMRKNSVGIMIYMVIFISISVMVSVSLSNSKPGNYVKNQKTIAVINMSNDKTSKELEKYLNKNFDVKKIRNDEKTIKENLFTQYVSYVLKINKDNSMEYYINKDIGVAFIVNGKVEEYLKTNKLLNKYNIENADSKTQNILEDNLEISYIKDQNTLKSESLYYYYNSQSFVVMSVIMIGVFIGYSKYKQRNVKDRIGSSAMASKKVETKVLLSSLIFVAFVWLVLLITTVVLFDRQLLFSSIGLEYILSSIIYLVPTYGLAYLIATISKDTNVNTALVNFIVLPLSFISGVFVPLEFLPKSIEKIAIISPMYWNNKLYRLIMDGSFGNSDTYIYIGIQILFFITFVLLGYMSSNRKTRTL